MAVDMETVKKPAGYKPDFVPKALKAMEVARTDAAEAAEGEAARGAMHSNGEGRDGMNEQAVTTAHITGSAIVLLVADMKASSEFYKRLGFTYEEIGGPDVSHVHVSRGSLTFILHPAKHRTDVRPASALEGGLYFDAYAYTDAVDLLAEQCKAQGVEIVNGPHYSEHWSEFTMKDLDGYRITFGGGVSTNAG